MRFVPMTVVVCLTTLVAYAAQAPQTATHVLTGRVVDAAAAPLAGATVTLAGSAAPARTTTTDRRGDFRFVDVPAGTYEIEIRLAGFVTLKRLIVVAASVNAPLTLTLRAEPPPKPGPAPAPEEVADTRRNAKEGDISRVPARIVVGGAVGGVPGNAAVHPGAAGPWPPDFNTEAYDRIEDNGFRSTRDDPLSTFSIDVDTASYANVRRFLNDGGLPPPDAVRIEEMINYFRFDYAGPKGNVPFAVTTEVTACPWNRAHRLALVGLQARPVESRDAARNLVFLLDVSGSMASPDKLPLVRKAMRMLVDTLNERDRIAIVVYAGAGGLVLPTTAGDRKERIHQAIARLEAGGSTNGGAGIELAYRTAQEQFVRGGINRVILATDGDFNVGVTSQGELLRLIEEKREAGVFLSVLGVGTGNLKDSTMEKLADKGNGNYSYLDSLHEARKVLVAEAGATLVTVAKDVKIQVEFNPAHVAAYRLVGYENRLLRNQDFNDDRKDAGEIGAGHSVTALYEIVPPGAPLDLPAVDPLRYQRPAGGGSESPAGNFSNPVPQGGPLPGPEAAREDELMLVKLRYKEPEGDTSKLLTFPVANRTAALSDNTGFAAAVAQFAMLLRKSTHKGAASYGETAALAKRHRGSDESGYRAEFVRLVELAEALTAQTSSRLPAPGFPRHEGARR